MLIKYNVLSNTLIKSQKPIYVLFGEDEFLLAQAALLIKKQTYKEGDCDFKTFIPQTIAQWHEVFDEANTFSLFSQNQIIEVYISKKTLEKAVEKLLQSYADTPNLQTLLIIKAPLIPLRALQGLFQHQAIDGIQIQPLTPIQQKDWIRHELGQMGITSSGQIIDTIFEFTQGNMLSCSQALQRLALFVGDSASALNAEVIRDLVLNQQEHENHELIEVVLKGDLTKALLIIKQAIEDRGEALLILWFLSQTIRELLALHLFIKKGMSFNQAAEKTKIWRSRFSLYQNMLKRISSSTLQMLLVSCQKLDIALKSTSQDALTPLTQMISVLCTGKEPYYEI